MSHNLLRVGQRPLTAVLAIVAAIVAVSAPVSESWADYKHPIAGHKATVIGDVTPERLLRAEAGEWMTGGRDYQQSYYSPLVDVNRTNITKLGFAWAYEIDFSTTFQATPIVVDGVMFTSGNHGKVYALDAGTGALRWSFEPKIDPTIFRKHCCGGINRGVALWRGMVYVGSLDGYLYALDANTGKVIWRADSIIDRSRNYSSSGAPYIAKELVVIGNSGGEYDARGYITAYDARTGRKAWRFFTVPGDPRKGFEHPEMEMAAKTWDPDSLWELGLGGTVWDGMTYDPKLNLLYVGTGNGLPWNRSLRSPTGGDNLFLSSILAINPDTGRLVWHYQTTPGDNWDYTATQKTILAELRISDRLRSVIMQAPKNGFFYVLDRATGELLSAKPYVYTNWASHVDLKTGRPLETGKADFSKAPKLVFPTTQGGHNWHPMAFNPRTGLVYIPTLEAGEVYASLPGPFTYKKDQWNTGLVSMVVERKSGFFDSEDTKNWPSIEALRAGEPDPRARNFIRAWDPVRQKLVWEVDVTEADDGLFRTPAGVMTTAGGLVFQGHPNGHLRAFDALTGAVLHDIDVGTSMMAAPMTYRKGGKQYVAIMAGVGVSPLNVDYIYGNKGRIIAFKLDGGAVPRRALIDRSADDLPPPVADTGTPAQIALGARLFGSHCAICHVYGTRAPELTRLTAKVHQEFLDIVLRGSRVGKGMGDFSAVLTQEDAEAIHAYIKRTSWNEYNYRMKMNREVRRKGG